jgi:proline iminopeptidase
VVLAVAEGAWVSQPATVQLAGGRQATYEVVGTGEPLLWIEGGPGFPADLGRPDVELLADRFCCYLIDAPGCGGSTPPAERRDWDHLGHARFFDEVRQALGLGPVTVMGHSWGGLIALTYATLVPAAVARCMVVDGYAGDSSVDLAEADAEQQAAFQRLAHYPWFPDALRLRQAFLAPPADPAAAPPQDPQGLRWRLYFADPERPSSLAHAERLVRAESRFNREVMEVWESDGLYASVDITPLLPRIACPTLVLVGRHDPVCGPVWARPLVAGVPDATLVVFADSGHVPAYEEPEAFRRTVLDWCSAHPIGEQPTPV